MPAHCGEPELVPPTVYQPGLQGMAPPQPGPLVFVAPRVMYTRTPVCELAW